MEGGEPSEEEYLLLGTLIDRGGEGEWGTC